ncbi:hypothetical protein R3P38DRAFT_2784017 [Favolaschia claudopus]|uniref:Uncharacterized protein n=1 Tax=Favolaschia claudopus TaxID=2862362 RepID=A0AAW0AX26_9AGAR
MASITAKLHQLPPSNPFNCLLAQTKWILRRMTGFFKLSWQTRSVARSANEWLACIVGPATLFAVKNKSPEFKFLLPSESRTVDADTYDSGYLPPRDAVNGYKRQLKPLSSRLLKQNKSGTPHWQITVSLTASIFDPAGGRFAGSNKPTVYLTDLPKYFFVPLPSVLEDLTVPLYSSSGLSRTTTASSVQWPKLRWTGRQTCGMHRTFGIDLRKSNTAGKLKMEFIPWYQTLKLSSTRREEDRSAGGAAGPGSSAGKGGSRRRRQVTEAVKLTEKNRQRWRRWPQLRQIERIEHRDSEVEVNTV